MENYSVYTWEHAAYATLCVRLRTRSNVEQKRLMKSIELN